ncbi:Putative serine/threonine-protein kinase/receptor R831 [Termitomyces sp. J132]|nr:Putative serine/threonine-protein kinase/receptor R831 [Termitomyces sp. J132]
MRRLSEQEKLYPTCFSLSGPSPSLEDGPVASGSFADIYKIRFQGEQTCYKVIRVYQKSQVEHLAKVYAREAILWGQLSHPNILPFYGLLRFGPRIAFVSRWATNGNLEEYLAHNPDVNRILLVCPSPAAGVEYLHNNDIVHGDLKGLNVLIDGSGRACLGDFIFTGRLPFYEISNQATIMLSIMQGQTPSRPRDDDAAWLKHGLNEHLWSLLEDCWLFQSPQRPDMTDVISRLNIQSPIDSRPGGEWVENAAVRFRNANSARGNYLLESSGPFWEDLGSLVSRIVPEIGEMTINTH